MSLGAAHARMTFQKRFAWLALCATVLFAGCASGPVIDTRYTAKGQDSRALFLILHFTDEGLADSLRILTEQQVSAHYLLSDENPPRIYRLVDESRRAWHAGDSFWKGHGMLNASSIGIEIVNPGQVPGPDGSKVFAPYPPAQIDELLRLVKDIVARHQIQPARILGHSDIAPQRKIDPGALFPWKRLADEGLIPWPDAQRVDAQKSSYEFRLPDVAWFQQALATHGFKVPATGVLDAATRRVIAAFQMKYRPARYDGEPDAETAAMLQVLNAPAAR
jgi:N-acetylmuramoyl-L-alanine amidase